MFQANEKYTGSRKQEIQKQEKAEQESSRLQSGTLSCLYTGRPEKYLEIDVTGGDLRLQYRKSTRAIAATRYSLN